MSVKNQTFVSARNSLWKIQNFHDFLFPYLVSYLSKQS